MTVAEALAQDARSRQGRLERREYHCRPREHQDLVEDSQATFWRRWIAHFEQSDRNLVKSH